MKLTGSCYYIGIDGQLWLAESFIDDAGNVMSQDTLIGPL